VVHRAEWHLRRPTRLERQPAARSGLPARTAATSSATIDSKTKSRARWHLPGDGPQPYAVYVDEIDAVWVSDWGANAILRFDPKTEKLESFPLRDPYASVRQRAGRKGEIWGAESGADKLFVLKAE
jgi:virginiamycin B lyase